LCRDVALAMVGAAVLQLLIPYFFVILYLRFF